MDFEPEEVAALQRQIMDLASGKTSSVVVDGETSVTLRAGPRDIGIAEFDAPRFSCVLRPIVWEQVAGLLEPFAESGQSGYQWLDETGPVKLLISSSGRW